MSAAASAASAPAAPALAAAEAQDVQPAARPPAADLTSKDYYFDSYAHFGIHEEMLKDEVRTKAYMRSIVNNRHLFKGKTVLDVGCGTGILSMFAAKAGAKRVYAVDFSGIAEQAKEIVKANGLSDVVQVIRGKIEEVELDCGLCGVDVIISEWMGYFLLYESMLDSVLVARDKWLNKKTGIMMPDKASLYVVGIEDAQYKEEKLHFWNNVYGFNMSIIKEMAYSEPLVETVDGAAVMTEPCLLAEFDIMTMKQGDVDFSASFEITATRDDYCHALLVYFDIVFSKCHKPVEFSTAPGAPYTHWKQTVFYLRDDLTMVAGETVQGKIATKQNKGNKRDLDIHLDYEFEGVHSQVPRKQLFFRLR